MVHVGIELLGNQFREAARGELLMMISSWRGRHVLIEGVAVYITGLSAINNDRKPVNSAAVTHSSPSQEPI